MTEYIAQCGYNRSDTIKALAEGEVVWLEPGDNNVGLSPDDARAFARGIMALADRVDGGEVTAASDTQPKVGDFVEITEDTSPVRVGQRGYLRAVDEFDPELPYRLELDEGVCTYDWWTRAVRKVDNPVADLAPLADWERDLLDSHAAAQKSAPGEPTVRGIKAGDKVRVLVDGAEFASVSVGDIFTVARVLGDEIAVNTAENDGHWYFRDPKSLEKVVDAPTTPEEPTKPSRKGLLEAAVDAMSNSYIYSAHDLIELAEFLAGE
ncbi:hypothetical protein ACIPJG_32385 [Streptomyces halstedii]|uniref:hypothetical protein n=1 Tax=Streptomyces halstedii TaxID=1944 RepID=UPI00382DCF6D